tara:strand:+ start:414 stop:1079 length:666 start_codon:yes stop_codon:yes gene_type:complete
MDKNIKTQKQALKEPLGTYYHPTKNTYRTGVCEIGKILKKGHTREIKNKNGKKKDIYIDPVCIKNKGKPGILITNKDNSKEKENKKMEKYIKEIKKTSYKSVIMKLYSQLKKKDIKNSNKIIIEKNINMLKKWRINNPEKKNNKIKKNDNINKKINNNLIKNNKKSKKNNNNYLFNSTLKEFEKNLNVDFLPDHKKKNNNNNIKIKELSTKQILNLIKNNN